MPTHSGGRREFLKTLVVAGAAARVKLLAADNSSAKFDLTVSEVEYRRTTAGRALMARIYQPVGAGPFPTLLDLHGGAWNTKNRGAEEPMDRAIAASGVLVIAVDLTLAPEAPYPACVQDANYAVRWLKSNAATWKGNASRLGIYGSSSGGHVGELLAMRPTDARYNAIPLPGGAHVDASVAYVAMRSPISNPFARFQNADKLKRADMVKNHTTFFVPWETIHESNPQEILDRHETVAKVPFLIMQGALDDNVLPEVQEKFAATYKATGGDVRYELFAGCEHEWVAKPGPQTDRADAERMTAEFHDLVTKEVAEPARELGDLRLLAGVRKFPQRVKCAMLAWRALEQAIHEGAGGVSTEEPA